MRSAFAPRTQLHERITARGVGLASVYRTLELLAEVGLAERRAEAGGEASYLYCSPRHHHHVICTECGTVREIDAAFCPDAAVIARGRGGDRFPDRAAHPRFPRPLRRMPGGE